MCDIIIVSIATTDSLSKHGSLSIPRTWRVKYNSTLAGQSFVNNYNEKKKVPDFSLSMATLTLGGLEKGE